MESIFSIVAMEPGKPFLHADFGCEEWTFSYIKLVILDLKFGNLSFEKQSLHVSWETNPFFGLTPGSQCTEENTITSIRRVSNIQAKFLSVNFLIISTFLLSHKHGILGKPDQSQYLYPGLSLCSCAGDLVEFYLLSGTCHNKCTFSESCFSNVFSQWRPYSLVYS